MLKFGTCTSVERQEIRKKIFSIRNTSEALGSCVVDVKADEPHESKARIK